MNIKKISKKIINEIFRYMPIKKKVDNPILYGNLLKNKTVLITGGNSGIGLEISKACIRNGANVIICGRNLEKLEKAELTIKSLNEDAFVKTLQLDISNIDKILLDFNIFINNASFKIDILINNAGTLCEKSFWDISEEEFDRVINVDLKGQYFLTREFSKYLINNKIKGHILNISSSSSIRPALSPYSFAKASTNVFTKGLAKELIKYGIVVNGLAPGPTATKMLLDDDSNINRPTSLNGRFATPEEIANLAVVLVSDLSSNVLGDTLFSTGGCGNLILDDWE